MSNYVDPSHRVVRVTFPDRMRMYGIASLSTRTMYPAIITVPPQLERQISTDDEQRVRLLQQFSRKTRGRSVETLAVARGTAAEDEAVHCEVLGLDAPTAWDSSACRSTGQMLGRVVLRVDPNDSPRSRRLQEPQWRYFVRDAHGGLVLKTNSRWQAWNQFVLGRQSGVTVHDMHLAQEDPASWLRAGAASAVSGNSHASDEAAPIPNDAEVANVRQLRAVR